MVLLLIVSFLRLVFLYSRILCFLPYHREDSPTVLIQIKDIKSFIRYGYFFVCFPVHLLRDRWFRIMQMYVFSYAEIWFLVVDGLCLFIFSVIIHVIYRHYKIQKEKLIDFTNLNQVNNPLSAIWAIIFINLFCQLVQITQGLVFIFQPS